MKVAWMLIRLRMKTSAHHLPELSANRHGSSIDGWTICQVLSFNSNDKYRMCSHNSFSSALFLKKHFAAEKEAPEPGSVAPLGRLSERKHQCSQRLVQAPGERWTERDLPASPRGPGQPYCLDVFVTETDTPSLVIFSSFD